MENLEAITVAAIIDQFGTPISLERPNRHHNIIRFLVERGDKKPITGIQGFMTSLGRFVDRETAAKIAIEVGQIEELKFNKHLLFSEDLW